MALTCELLFTLVVSTDSGPVLKSSSSFFSSSSTVGFVAVAMLAHNLQASPSTPYSLDAGAVPHRTRLKAGAPRTTFKSSLNAILWVVSCYLVPLL